ncbi:MAG TPA: 3-hydroxybutyryl-CoA dehydrogenase, partial [Pricia antarctica]|nr:3-hydroxybutyryl-CoA dehydrogenase [Pricia antarctica]
MKRIAVIGAGTMGNGIAHVFAQSGYAVNLIDISQDALENGLANIEKNLDRMVSKEKINSTVKRATLANIKTHTLLSKGVMDANLVVEAASEKLEIKLRIFEELDIACPS